MSARDVRNVWIVSLVMALHAVAAEEESRIKPGHNLLQEADHRPAICPGGRHAAVSPVQGRLGLRPAGPGR
jgi:hypothetical protein